MPSESPPDYLEVAGRTVWVEAKRSAAETQHPRRAVNCWVLVPPPCATASACSPVSCKNAA